LNLTSRVSAPYKVKASELLVETFDCKRCAVLKILQPNFFMKGRP
jgi:hypothetical protein